MSTPEINVNKPKKKGMFYRFLDWIEVNGNKLPDVLTLFVIFTVIILITSAIAGLSGWSAINPATKEKIDAVNLLNGDGIKRILSEMVKNFVNFPPLGIVLVVMLGVGLAESTGLISAFMRKVVLSAPSKLILPIIVIIGIVGNAAADAALIVLPPVAAMIFLALKRNPIAGLVAAYAAVAGGFSANIIINVLDAMLAGFTETSAQILDPSYKANPAMNYYFLFASTFVLLPVAVFVTTKIVEPRLGTYHSQLPSEESNSKLTVDEKKGLKWATISLSIYILILLAVTLPPNALLRHPETGSIVVSPFMDSLVGIMFLFFFIPALAYGIGAKTIKSDKDVAEQLSKAMSGMGYYIVLAFIAAQMITYFSWSNLGAIIAIKGAEALQSIGLVGLPLLIGFIIFTAIVNLLIASSSAKWALLGPVFVPMFMLLGYSPAFTQVAYRIGDSITNTITPMLAYFAILLSFAKKFDKNMGVGTLISSLIPFTIAFGIFWIILFSVWYLLGLPLGPGSYIKLN
ncbi:AbgT family transporter [Bacillus sp. S/N-304-OC-R1]|uniref:AbgT family transporter n=1 Tax=Bacillus sp. S/N-304-OC-R1 TaxID=2758034 RepID=UPI001C8ECA92|nr:AbgT family transporter [Bacillus sp. S/N-304-OC-R1]MBY0121692.1 AbgT family transporter [Bacillus sp. S/N-304-OC-R1]